MRTILLLTILYATCLVDAFAKPVVWIPDDLTITSQNTVDIPIYISDITNDISGYILRMNYADQLTHPTVITEGTLSEGHLVKSGPPTDALGGKLAIGLMAGFQPQTDGLMLIIRFTISPDFKQSDITFLMIKSRLHTAVYQEIPAGFQDGFIQKMESVYLDMNNDRCLNLIDVIMFMKKLGEG
jgi:hypothetical protein